jgi:hypothetical protein
MLGPLVVGSLTIIVNMGIQILAVVLLVRFFIRRAEGGPLEVSFGNDARSLSIVLLFLLAGHIMQFAIWAWLFMLVGEFADFATAFYHSTVNFAALGYGDIVMSEKWRLLGALEAANGVLMFGLSAGTILSVMNRIFSRHRQINQPGSDG